MLSQDAFQKLQMANFSLRRVLRDSSLSVLKGELKAEISNFSKISEVNLVKLFSLVYCFFARKLRSKLDFFRFCDLFIVGSKTKSAAGCDV